MKKFFLIILIVGLVTIGAFYMWFGYRTPHTIVLPKNTAVQENLHPVMRQDELKKEERSVLNLALPQNTFLMDSKITLPDPTYNWHDLFTHTKKENRIVVGGHLILDEKEPEPNAAIWDQVKGAEVGITIKTP